MLNLLCQDKCFCERRGKKILIELKCRTRAIVIDIDTEIVVKEMSAKDCEANDNSDLSTERIFFFVLIRIENKKQTNKNRASMEYYIAQRSDHFCV